MQRNRAEILTKRRIFCTIKTDMAMLKFNYTKQRGDDKVKKNLEMKQNKVKTVSGNWKTQLGYWLMTAPGLFMVILFSYIPMIGIWLAFVDYKPAKGFFGSDFVGLRYFKQFLESSDLQRVLRNTIGYSVANLVIVKLLVGVIFALLLYEVKNKVTTKVYHTCMLLPAFLSWTVVSASLLILLNPDSGMVNSLLESMGLQPVSWYREKAWWPYIIMFAQIYKSAGMASMYFYSALLSIDTELFDAANLDGANRLQQIVHISLPSLSNIFCLTLIMGMGGIINTSMAPYYQLTFNSTVLYDTTLTLGTYLYNGISGGRYSFTAAVGLFDSVIGLVMTLVVNGIVKRIDPDSAMF